MLFIGTQIFVSRSKPDKRVARNSSNLIVDSLGEAGVWLQQAVEKAVRLQVALRDQDHVRREHEVDVVVGKSRSVIRHTNLRRKQNEKSLPKVFVTLDKFFERTGAEPEQTVKVFEISRRKTN